MRNAATVFVPSENPDPVNVASTPIFTVCGVVARTSPARVIASKSSPQIMTRRGIQIFIGAIIFAARSESQESSRGGMHAFGPEILRFAQNDNRALITAALQRFNGPTLQPFICLPQCN